MDPAIEVTLIAIVFVSLSTWLQRRFMDTKRVAELQHLMNIKSKELSELHKNNASDEVKRAKMDELQAHSMESMRHMMKPLLVALPLGVLLYYVALPAAFPTNPTVSVGFLTLNYRNFFILVSFIFGIILQQFLQKRDTARMLKEKAAEAKPPAQ